MRELLTFVGDCAVVPALGWPHILPSAGFKLEAPCKCVFGCAVSGLWPGGVGRGLLQSVEGMELAMSPGLQKVINALPLKGSMGQEYTLLGRDTLLPAEAVGLAIFTASAWFLPVVSRFYLSARS